MRVMYKFFEKIKIEVYFYTMQLHIKPQVVSAAGQQPSQLPARVQCSAAQGLPNVENYS